MTNIIETRSCGSCNSTGKAYGARKCELCSGTGRVVEPNYPAILALITTGRGASKGKRRIYSSFPSKLLRTRFSDPLHGAAYYVWRMARFSGGIDVTMPFTAIIVLRGHPWMKELNAFADAIAGKSFGTDMAGALRWASALGYDTSKALATEPNLPPTAYPCGPEKMKG
jgi:hypothetical protein